MMTKEAILEVVNRRIEALGEEDDALTVNLSKKEVEDFRKDSADTAYSMSCAADIFDLLHDSDLEGPGRLAMLRMVARGFRSAAEEEAARVELFGCKIARLAEGSSCR